MRNLPSCPAVLSWGGVPVGPIKCRMPLPGPSRAACLAVAAWGLMAVGSRGTRKGPGVCAKRMAFWAAAAGPQLVSEAPSWSSAQAAQGYPPPRGQAQGAIPSQGQSPGTWLAPRGGWGDRHGAGLLPRPWRARRLPAERGSEVQRPEGRREAPGAGRPEGTGSGSPHPPAPRLPLRLGGPSQMSTVHCVPSPPPGRNLSRLLYIVTGTGCAMSYGIDFAVFY